MGAKLKNTVRQRDNGEKRAEQDKYEIQKTHAWIGKFMRMKQ